MGRLTELQEFLDARLKRYTQVTYAVAFYEEWDRLKKSRLAEENAQAVIPSNYFWADVVKIHLHWLLSQKKDKSYRCFDVSASNSQPFTQVGKGESMLKGL